MSIQTDDLERNFDQDLTLDATEEQFLERMIGLAVHQVAKVAEEIR